MPLDPASAYLLDAAQRTICREPEELAFVRAQMERLRAGMAEGGLREAMIRAVLYVGLPGKAVDERAFAVIRKIRSERSHALPPSALKALIRAQFLMLLLDEEQAIATLPGMLQGQEADASRAFASIEQVARAHGDLSEEAEARLQRIRRVFGAVKGEGKTAQRQPSAAEATDTAAE